ncbi:MAG: hypothetical protein A3C56_06275 [Ignavibacteria bacterium RIFCSPHIGHO2_02_FULL_56_12]|nr:MAG: hypothetical protein A3C56_06275 [Ignavibacteria bacterium RIFCSPHIGHO2_02_FULL_56_12]
MTSWRVLPSAPVHFTTSTIVDWTPVFAYPQCAQMIIDSLKYSMLNKGLRLHGYVIMPTHVHALYGTTSGVNLSNILRDLHRYTSKEISQFFRSTRNPTFMEFAKAARADQRGNRYKVWQTGFHPIAIFDQDIFVQKLEYIHNNPVRKGFVEQPEYWKYSSARNYLLDDDTIIAVEKLV